jgi:hypothetical protein
MSRTARRVAVAVTLLVFAASVYVLVTGSPLLFLMAIEPIGLPLGNVTTWAGITALPAAGLLGFSDYLSQDTTASRVFRSIMRVLMVLASGWGLVSFGLAGNWAFNFSSSTEAFRGSALAGEFFRIYTVSIVAATLLLLLVLLAASRIR